jgi:NAD(P)-dependent dehydrogenase (short-subunit alcohol dehydrogenase family)
MMVRIYAAEVANSKVRVNLVNPGAVKSALRSQAYPGEDPKIAKDPECIAGLFVELASPACAHHGETLPAG